MVLFLKTREIPSRREDFHSACGNVAPSSVRLYFPLTRFSSSFANIGCKFLKIICFWREFFSAFNLCAFRRQFGENFSQFCEKIEKMGNIGLIFAIMPYDNKQRRLCFAILKSVPFLRKACPQHDSIWSKGSPRDNRP